MMQTIEIQHRIESLVELYGLHPTAITPIAQSGSERKYFRIEHKSGSVIGTYNTNQKENEAFFHFSHQFRENGLNVPEVLAVSDDRLCYLQTDFGDDNLFAHVQKALATNGFDTNLIGLYKNALDQLVRFQFTGSRDFDYSKAYPSASFERQDILDDLNYFKYYFVKPHEGILFDEGQLRRDFNAFADLVSQAPSEFFMYRDFQSRNIIVKDNELYFIDFQGGRKGPLNYDVASMLYQVKAQMPQAVRDELVGYYKMHLSQFCDPEAVRFDHYQPYFVYLRLLQVLGAYGFRGLIQKKPHFLESIPYALREIAALTQTHPLDDFPEMKNILLQIKELKYKDFSPSQTGKLTIDINSFSFRKGYPTDLSGNGGGFVFDCRAMPNPGRMPEFRAKTGRDWEVIDYLTQKPQVEDFLENVKHIVNQSIENYKERHFCRLSVSFGCTGGQHRSVFFAQTLYEWLKTIHPDICLKLHHIEQNIQEEYGL